MLNRVEQGKTYEFTQDYYGGCSCGSREPKFKQGKQVVAERTQEPDSDGEVKINGYWVRLSYLKEV